MTDDYSELLKDTLLEVWEKYKYQELGNMQKIVRETIFEMKKSIEEETPGKEVNFNQFENDIIKELTQMVLDKYPDDLESFILEPHYDEHDEIAAVFVFLTDEEFIKKYEDVQIKAKKRMIALQNAKAEKRIKDEEIAKKKAEEKKNPPKSPIKKKQSPKKKLKSSPTKEDEAEKAAERKESNLLRLKSKELMKKKKNKLKLNTDGIEVSLYHDIYKWEKGEKEQISYDDPESEVKKTEQEITEFNVRFILGLFSELDKEAQNIVKRVIADFAERSSKALKKADSSDYNEKKSEAAKRRYGGFESKLFQKFGYYKIDVADLLVITFKLVRFMTGLNIQMELISDEIYVKLFVKNSKMMKLSEVLEYEFQIKPYASYYSILKEKKREKKDFLNEIEAKQIVENYLSYNPQFHELDRDDQKLWPDYVPYYFEKQSKYMRYLKNDDTHKCPDDDDFFIGEREEFDEDDQQDDMTCFKCSNFRNIDKLRLAVDACEEIINLNQLCAHPMFVDRFYLKNYIQYEDKISQWNLIWKRFNIYNSTTQNELVQEMRNYHGEKMGFYFLFLVTFNKSLVVLGIIGAGLFIVTFLSIYKGLDLGPVKRIIGGAGSILDGMDLIVFGIVVIVSIWGSFLLKHWECEEKVRSYQWGMNNLESNTPYSRDFEYDEKNDFVFDKRVPRYGVCKKAMRMIISFLVLIILCGISIVGVYFLFSLDHLSLFQKKSANALINPLQYCYLNNSTKNWTQDQNNPFKYTETFNVCYNKPFNSDDYDTDFIVLLIIGVVNGIQIEISSLYGGWVLSKMTEFENHEKIVYFENSLILKRAIFDFVNNFNSLIYIAFFKYLFGFCFQNNCLYELTVQTYLILAVKMVMKILEYYAAVKFKGNSFDYFYENNPNAEIKNGSLIHQRLLKGMYNLIKENNENFLLFSYICFFSSAGPLIPGAVFFILYFKKIIETYNINFARKVVMKDGDNGIGIYKSLYQGAYFVGLLCNISVALFANPSMIIKPNPNFYGEKGVTYDPTKQNNWLYLKFTIIGGFEVFIVALYFFIDINTFPHWFNNVNIIRNLNTRKYFDKDEGNLLHHQFIEYQSEIKERQEEELMSEKRKIKIDLFDDEAELEDEDSDDLFSDSSSESSEEEIIKPIPPKVEVQISENSQAQNKNSKLKPKAVKVNKK